MTAKQKQNIPMDQPCCVWLAVCPSLGPSDQAFRNVVVILRVWPQCWEMNGGLSGSHAGNKVMCVPSLKFRVYVTCKAQIDWCAYAGEGNRVVYLLPDVILWLVLGFYTSALRLAHTQTHSRIPGRRCSWLETRPIWTQFSPTDSRNNKKQQQKMHADVCR